MSSGSESEEIEGLHSSNPSDAEVDDEEGQNKNQNLGRRSKPSKEASRKNKRSKSEEADNFKEYIDEDVEEDSAEEDEADPITRQKLRELYQRKQQTNLIDLDMDAEKLAERYDKQAKELENDNSVISSATLPSLNDPRLFRVKCKAGCEKEACVRLLRKYFDRKNSLNPLNIYSVSALDKLVGFIYVEAMKPAYVKEAVMDMLDLNPELIQQVKTEEIGQVFAPDPTKNKHAVPYTFCRMTSGVYQGDLGLVLGEEEDGSARVKLIPRLNVGNNYEKSRPPPKLFNPEIFPSSVLLESDFSKKRYKLNNQIFEDGFLIKKFALKNLNFSIPVLSFEEYKIFVQNEQDEIKAKITNNLKEQNEKRKVQEKNLQRGDKVAVLTGDYIGSRGTVIEAGDGSARILLQPETIDTTGVGSLLDKKFLREPIVFRQAELGKIFELGERVECVEGRHKGVRGIVIKIEKNTAKILEEGKKDEVVVELGELRLADRVENAIPQLLKSAEAFQMYELVSLTGQKGIGAVVKQTTTQISLLGPEGLVQTVNRSEVSGKVPQGHAKNSQDQDIKPRALIKVRSGPRKDSKAVVKHVYGRTAWLFDSSAHPGHQLFVEDVDNCYLLDSTEYDRTRYNGRLNNFQQNPIQTSNTMQMNNPQSNRVALIGQKKKILRGQWKGYEGVIRSIVADSVEFELSARNKIVTVPISFLDVNVEPVGGRTPLMRPQGANTNYLATPGYDPDFKY